MNFAAQTFVACSTLLVTVLAATLRGLTLLVTLVASCGLAADSDTAGAPQESTVTAATAGTESVPVVRNPRLPNIVVVFVDDLGYGDVGGIAERGYETPHLDRLEREGIKFTNFYVAQAVCGASRAALLTGCYPNRLGMLGAPGPASKHGINERELLIPEMLRGLGYATGMVGKWHLGHHQKFLPTHHGFDSYFGLPYSNDMWPYHPENPKAWPNLPLIAGDEVINPEVTSEDQTMLTQWYTDHALEFIDANHEQPFFLYLAHSMPHVPLFVSERYRGVTPRGLYGDVVSEIDWSVGQILAALERHGLDEQTLVIFTSDNGPWLSYGNHAGSAGPLREGKGTSFEGGVRVPCLMRWPGRIPSRAVCNELTATIDLLPTLAGLTGGQLPDHPIDGLDIWPLISGRPGAVSPHTSYLYYWGAELQAIRSGDWKLHFPHDYRALTGTPGRDGRPAGYTSQKIEKSLFNLRTDVGERTDLSAAFPGVVAQLEALADAAREELGDSARNQRGTGYREPGQLQ